MTENQEFRQALDDRLALYRSILAVTVELKEALEDARWESLEGLVSVRQDLIDLAEAATPTLAELATQSLSRGTPSRDKSISDQDRSGPGDDPGMDFRNDPDKDSGNDPSLDPAAAQEIKDLLEEITRLGAEIEAMTERKLAEASQGLEGLERSHQTLQAYRNSLTSGGPAPRFIDEKK